MAKEQTLAILKPDAYERGLMGEIITLIQNGFDIVEAKLIRLTKEQAEEFYGEHEGQDFFDKWTDFMSSNFSMVIVIEGPDAIKRWRTLMGPKTDDSHDTIRGKWGLAANRNLVHGSDSPESAKREIKFFFEDSRYINENNGWCYFLDPEYGEDYYKGKPYNHFLFVPKEWWEAEGCLNDDAFYRAKNHGELKLPLSGGEYIESGWEVLGTLEEGKALLEEYGFEEADMSKRKM